jgi:hypothetical protein
MGMPSNYLPCDGCDPAASPEHIADRVRRLELSTRFRPVHVGIAFVALAPSLRPEDDFYGPAESKEFFDPFLEALEISTPDDKTSPGSDSRAADAARLAEFQRRGYFLAYLSECPILESAEASEATVARLTSTLIRRIRFNYRPKHIAPMGQEMLPLVDLLKAAGFGPTLLLDQGGTLPAPSAGDRKGIELFQRTVSTVALHDNLSAGYGRIGVTQSDKKLGVGGNT